MKGASCVSLLQERESRASVSIGALIPKHGMRKLGKFALTHIDIMKRGTGLEKEDINTAMQDGT